MNDRRDTSERRRWCPPQLAVYALAPAEPLSQSAGGVDDDDDMQNRNNWVYVTF